MARVRNRRQPAPRSDLELRNSQCSALRSTSGFCRPQCFSTRSCRRRSRLPQSSFRVPQLPNVSDASARSSGRSGATDKVGFAKTERPRQAAGRRSGSRTGASRPMIQCDRSHRGLSFIKEMPMALHRMSHQDTDAQKNKSTRNSRIHVVVSLAACCASACTAS